MDREYAVIISDGEGKERERRLESESWIDLKSEMWMRVELVLKGY